MKRSWHWRIRKTHRYLGVLIGVQFLFWTVGGLYFSWSNLDDIHGDPMKRPPGALPLQGALVSPSVPLEILRRRAGIDSIMGLQLIDVLGQPIYQLTYRTQDGHGHARTYTQLADARTGQLRNELTKGEATRLAQRRFAGSSAVERVEYLMATDPHHEYRAKPLPAYAVTFRQPAHATIYVAAQLGTVQSIRTDPWRMFDWLWMLHTMDYQGRDNINNGLLRAFSGLGLLTILSGFALYFVSSPRFRRQRPNSRKPIPNRQ
ncbi:hypothetical protein [Nibrella saemangeumensis]